MEVCGFDSPITRGGSMEEKKKYTEEKGVVTLCGGGGCCPTVDFTFPGIVIVRDDYGGKVRLTRDEWNMLKNSFDSSSK